MGLLGYYPTAIAKYLKTFRRVVFPPYSGSSNPGGLLPLLGPLDSEDTGSMLARNFGNHLPVDIA